MELIGSLLEIIGDKCHSTVVKKTLMEDSNVIVPMLDSFTSLNLDKQLQEQWLIYSYGGQESLCCSAWWSNCNLGIV
ncbi:hypothetical protein KFK09_020569 [Dendrobium nobile]|uniref:Uncharacterized protein n=1 Tax=Dendrobium nobile TaxID=94219 RepID=A0A8T3ALB4_DENNO|nr:hypothetical protein KFK09_020569 [Dendrobium nobile]